MKKIQIIRCLIIIIGITFVFISCSNERPVIADTPTNAAWLMKRAIDSGNYDNFNKLFSEGRKNSISKEKFNELKKVTTNGSDFKHYELVTFTNGEMLLIKLTPEKVDGEYKIEDIIRIPDDIKSIFKNN